MPSDKDLRQAEFFRNRIVKNEKALRRWARSEGIEALRLYDRDIPEVPLALDRYGNALLLALYERPYEKDEELEAEWLQLMCVAASEALGIDEANVFTKKRKRQRGMGQYERFGTSAAERTVREGGLSFIVNLSDYLDTGLFLDHRLTRALVRSESAGREVLNLFSYTGSFSVYAASGGAKEVTSVDLSNTYLAWASRNLTLNGFSTSRNPLVRADAKAFLAAAAAAGRRWDLIVADPPTFSNSKGTEQDFDVNKDWPDLLRACVAVLSPGGLLYFSSNSRKLKWSSEIAAEIAEKAGAIAAAGPVSVGGLASRKFERGSWEDIGEATIPRDFRDAKTHRCWRLRAASG